MEYFVILLSVNLKTGKVEGKIKRVRVKEGE